MRPNKIIRNKFNTDYRDSSVFTSRARLLQSLWRLEKKYDFEKYGNFLLEDFAIESGANFLTDNIFKVVKHEVKNKNIDGKLIQEPRIWNNLLSSQPLAFNLFGEMKLNTLTCPPKTDPQVVLGSVHTGGRKDGKAHTIYTGADHHQIAGS